MAVRSGTPSTLQRDVPPRSGGGAAAVWLLAVCLVAVLVPIGSAALGLAERIQHWGKVIHAVDALCVTLVVGMLLMAWRDRESVQVSDQLAALTTLFVGLLFGVVWEMVVFVIDWIASSSVQKSNSDTMTNLLWNDVCSVIGALLAVRLYCHWVSVREREGLGRVAAWLVGGPSRLLDRHGFLITIVLFVIAGLAVGALWFTGRPMPGLAIP